MPDPTPIDKLEANPLPPSIEIAQGEYFADLAFEPRLLDVLECISPKVSIDVSSNTQQILHPVLFTPNFGEEVQSEGDKGELITISSTAFHAVGELYEQPGKLEVDLRICPEFGEQSPLIIKSTGIDKFFVYNEGSTEFEVFSTPEFADFSLKAAGVDKNAREQLFSALNGHGITKWRTLITELWKSMAERSGTMQTTKTLDQKLMSTSGTKLRAKLQHETIETPSESRISMTLERVIEHTDLDVEEAYTLILSYVSRGDSNSTREANKYTVSGVNPMRLTSLRASCSAGGRVTKLDVSDPGIMELFVDTFDELLTA